MGSGRGIGFGSFGTGREIASDFVQGEATEVFALEEIWIVRFFFRVFTGFDGEAEGTGVVAVEGHGDGSAEGVLLAEVGEHADPGDTLEEHPVQSDAGG